MPKKKPKRLKPIEIVSGHVRQELSPEQIMRVRRVWVGLGELTGCSSLEEFELGFMRDLMPDREIFVWEGILICCLKTQERAKTPISKEVAQAIVNYFIGKTAGLTLTNLLDDHVRETAERVWANLHGEDCGQKEES